MSSSLKEKILRIVVNLCRFLIAGTFIFSGFVKAVDPVGSQIKITDYYSAFGLSDVFPDYVIIMQAILLSTIEFIIGLNMLLAIRRKATSILLLIFMLVMTPLTLYLAIANPVSDCGCFGDAVHLTNWETFAKNVVLLAASVLVLWKCNYMFRVMTWRVQWIVVTYSLIFIIGVSVYCFNNLPIFDFRPYKIGVNIPEAMSIPEGAQMPVYETTFILEKDGVEKEFALDEYPTDTSWQFVDSKTVLVKAGYEPPIHDFSITRLDGEDITEQVLNDSSYTFLLIMSNIEKASDLNIDRINDIYDYSVDYGYNFYCLTASSDEMIDYWHEYMGAEYESCITDETTLKTIIRSNPGMVLIKNGTIINKWHHRNLPTEHELTGPLDTLPIGHVDIPNGWTIIFYVMLLYILPLALIIGIEAIWLKAKNIGY